MTTVRNLACLALLAACACSANDATSPSGGRPAGDASTSEGEDAGNDETPPPSIPDPGSPPSQVAGIFSFDFLQEGSGEAKLQASAIFTSPPPSLQGSPFPDIFSGYESVPIDDCASLPVINVSGGQANPLDAGEIAIVGPDASRHTVTRTDFFGMVVYGGDLPASAFQPFAEYRLEATGSPMLPGFSGSFWTPGSLTVTAPSSSGKLTVERSQSLDLRWEGQGNGEPVLIRMTQRNTTVVCRAEDDGEFTIPASALGFFSPSGSAEPGQDEEADVLLVQRLTWYTVGEGSSAALALSAVGAKYEVDFR